MSTTHWHERIAMPTRHGKVPLIAPILEPATGCTLVHIEQVDTDQFGSFTRDIARPGSQLDAARAKAQAGLQASGLPLALASEGAFVQDPFTGLMPWNVELIVLIDPRHGSEIVGIAQGPARCGQGWAKDSLALLQLAVELGFPEHQLCVRPDHSEDPRVHKGLASEAALLSAFATALAQSSQGQVFVESDLRAHCNPTRQAMIRRAAEDLRHKMLSCCPACGRPGYAVTRHRPGRLCRACGAATALTLARIWSCGHCQHSEERVELGDVWASPSHCHRCNP